ncbi:AraC family transcriptional regulator [Phaeobacter sp. HF9A]|uniref:AraC family transcriptional regulator n=1 Tax=Phaeobacter sp. HF9A TaxID=2721561 RepID=UPI00142FC956|nr:AraC family transcriptional regulator [Phaeobacter sp. HF9A]NIZ15260.1 AraC family transcriptional regulator [Phaeobacter sp. HF9A]
MAQAERFPFIKALKAACAILGIAPERVIRRAGLPVDLLTDAHRGVSGHQTFALWTAIFAEAGSYERLLHLAKTSARTPFKPALLAFSCSPDVVTGLERLNLFKPLVAPVTITCAQMQARTRVIITSTLPDEPLPGVVAVCELVFFLELIRNCTAHHVVPLAATLPASATAALDIDLAQLEAEVGCQISTGENLSFLLAPEDSSRRLISEASDVWPAFEKELRRQMMDWQGSQPTSARVKAALLELLPSGQATADAVCRQMLMSKRTLYRHLAREDVSFQSILDETRTELALHYLRQEDISIEEISYLLAYSDANSFYRAFRNWTGQTPLQARAQLTASAQQTVI